MCGDYSCRQSLILGSGSTYGPGQALSTRNSVWEGWLRVALELWVIYLRPGLAEEVELTEQKPNSGPTASSAGVTSAISEQSGAENTPEQTT